MSALAVEMIPALSDNYVYLVHEPAAGVAGVIDPAVAAPVMDRLSANGWSLDWILSTHHHADHTGGNLELKDTTGCRIAGPGKDAARIPGIDVKLVEGDRFRLGEAEAEIFETPGHTSGHISFWFPESNALFCADTLFSLGCGRLFEGTPADMWASLGKFADLPDEALVYCGHEYTQSNARFALSVDPNNGALQAARGRGGPPARGGRAHGPDHARSGGGRPTRSFGRTMRRSAGSSVLKTPGTSKCSPKSGAGKTLSESAPSHRSDGRSAQRRRTALAGQRLLAFFARSLRARWGSRRPVCRSRTGAASTSICCSSPSGWRAAASLSIPPMSVAIEEVIAGFRTEVVRPLPLGQALSSRHAARIRPVIHGEPLAGSGRTPSRARGDARA